MKPRSMKLAVAAALVSLLSAPLFADEGAFLKELEQGRQVLRGRAEAQKCRGDCRKRRGEAQGSLRGASSPAVKAIDHELRGKTTIAGSGRVYRHASQPHWFSGTAAVKGVVKLTGKDGVYGTAELSGDIYVSGSGHWATGPAAGQGQVVGAVELFTKEGTSLGVFRISKAVTVSGWADGDKAEVSGVAAFE